ncbi:hypothetical protein B7P43_G01582, partial [Cryptotermes secundus]
HGDYAMKKTAVYTWVTSFSEGRESVTDEERSGRPATSRTEENIKKNRQIVRENHRITVRSMAEQSHTALPAREFLASKQITVLEHLPYSPDLAPSDFFLLPKVKEVLKGRHFDDIDDIRSNTTEALKAIPQNQCQKCFERWTSTSKY